jgi:hypothetical protein
MDILDELDHRLIAIVFLVLLMIFGEIAFRAGRRTVAPLDEIARSQVGTMQAAVLGLLGLLLAFTFGIAQDRYETRRLMVVHEADAISTAYLRADVLPDPVVGEVRRLFRDYVDVRIDYYRAADEHNAPELIANAERIQGKLWKEAVHVAHDDPRSVPVGLFLQSLNETFDVYDQVLAAQIRIPGRIIALLMLVAIVGVGTVGYAFGLGRRRQVLGTVMLSVLVSAIVLVSLDLDRPRTGRIRVGFQSMQRLWETVNRTPAVE